MNIIEQKIQSINPVYLEEFETIIKQNSQFGGGAEEDKYIYSKSFSNVYEFYMYAFFIGLYKNLSEEILPDDKTKTFWNISNWKPKNLVDYLLVCAISESDFDMAGIEQMDDADIIKQVKLIKEVIEKYANGGLRYIKDKLDEDSSLLEDDTFFIKVLAKANQT